MANYSTSANVVLSINGKQAQQMLNTLQKQAQQLETKLARAATAGDKATMKKLQKELTSTNRLIQQMQGSTATVEQTLARLDKATPRDLQKTLRTLTQQLNGIERGTKAWDAHTAKIKAVKAELQKVNATLTTQRTLWQKMNSWLNNCQTAILGIGAAITGLIMAGRKAVNAFAEMEEQLANTRKYTGMTVEDVNRLNEAFQKMDTRTPRAKLNELAQEAGRLGKTALEDVKGYVEAADIINVALVDLGAGATQTIAKLTNIFGVEQMLGTRDAMLAVGSTVNVLSQNCTASKPYLVEFAQRMAGIGAQAGLTIPEILAFGAVLDANGQKVEMSATAIQKVIMNLANKNKEFARTLGLDAEVLADTLKRSAKDGLLMFLDALHAVGEASDYQNATMVLAPALKDMGLDAARVSQVLSTLAKHIDEVRDQINNANVAFNEATSATREYDIFNRTAQASIDKAKKRVNELAISLGEKLYPIMRHIYTSSGIFLRVLNQIVTFLIKHGHTIATVTTAIVAYNAVILVYNARTAIAAKSTALFHGALSVAKGIIPPLRLIMAALTNSVQYLTNGLNVNYTMQQRWRKSMEAMKFSSWVGLIIALGTAIYALTTRMSKAEKEAKEFADKMKEATAKAHGFDQEAQKEIRDLDILFGKLKGCREGTEEYRAVKDKIISQYKQYLTGLINERGEIVDLTRAYNRLAQAARRSAQERGIAAAEGAINEAYYEENTRLLDSLQSSLEEYGASVQDAARIVQEVAVAMASGNAVPDNIVAEINGYAANSPTGLSWSQMLHYRANNTAGVAGDINKVIATIFSLGGEPDDMPVDPASVVNAMYDRRQRRDNALSNLDLMHDGVNPMRRVNDTEINWAVESLKQLIATGQGGSALVHSNGNVFEYVELTLQEARNLLAQYEDELAIRGSGSRSGADADITDRPEAPNLNLSETAAEKKARLEAERKAKQALKEDLKEQKRLRDEGLAENQRQRNEDLISEAEYLAKKDELNLDYLAAAKRVLEQRGLQETAEYAALVRQEEEITAAAERRMQNVELKDLKSTYTLATAANTEDYREGRKDYAAYMDEKERLDLEYLNARLEIYRRYRKTDTTEYAALLVEQERMLQEHAERQKEIKRRQLDQEHLDKLNDIEIARYTPGSDSYLSESAYEQQVFEELVRYLQAKRDTYLKGSQEWQRLDDQITEATRNRAASKKKEYSDAYKTLMAEEVNRSEYQRQLDLITQVYQQELQLAEGNEKRKLALTRAYNIARLALAKKYGVLEGKAFEKAIAKSAKWLSSEGGQAFTGAMSTIAQGMSDIFSGVTDLMQAELDIQTAAIENKYDAEISRAEGNSYLVAKLEKEKEAEIAKAKNEANRKMFAMQVIQAVAQTAQNAISAYGSAAAIPVVGYILAPIAAAMAVAAGALQIAAIKKQQQASEAQGYAEGGFTPDGDKDTAVGVVHAGEWVASQRLVKNARVRPLLEALDRAQRTNTVGSLTPQAVSAMLPAGSVYRSAGTTQSAINNLPTQSFTVKSDPAETSASATDPALAKTLDRLNSRLASPLGAVVTVSGDQGIAKAQDEYATLLANKTPKSKR